MKTDEKMKSSLIQGCCAGSKHFSTRSIQSVSILFFVTAVTYIASRGTFLSNIYGPPSDVQMQVDPRTLVFWNSNSTVDPEELRRLKSGKDLARFPPKIHDPVEDWNRWTTRAREWYTNNARHDVDPNWPGRRAMHKALQNGSMWWDEDAEEYILAQIEKSQYPADCSKAHWIAHRSWLAGMFSNVHQLTIPLLLGVIRGHTVLDVDRDPVVDNNPTYFGCSPGMRNLHSFFNLSTCSPVDVLDRLNKTMEFNKFNVSGNAQQLPYVAWSDILTRGEDLFPPGGVTLVKGIHSYQWRSGLFSYGDAFAAGKVKLIQGMVEKGMVGVYDYPYDFSHKGWLEPMRVDFTLLSMMSSWMLSKTTERVKTIADNIMARYSDDMGRPAWTPPVLTIHIRQSDKKWEDPFWKANGRYRNASEYVNPVRELEKEFGFEWPSVLVISDSGSALAAVAAEIMGATNSNSDPLSMYNSTAAARKDGKRLIMYDWTSDIHVYEKFREHSRLPRQIKVDMQEHFLATLYICQMITDYAVVTYSSNVGRFIGEIMTATHRMALPFPKGPIVMSLDGAYWHE